MLGEEISEGGSGRGGSVLWNECVKCLWVVLGVQIVLQVFVMSLCTEVSRIEHSGSGTVLGTWLRG